MRVAGAGVCIPEKEVQQTLNPEWKSLFSRSRTADKSESTLSDVCSS